MAKNIGDIYHSAQGDRNWRKANKSAVGSKKFNKYSDRSAVHDAKAAKAAGRMTPADYGALGKSNGR